MPFPKAWSTSPEEIQRPHPQRPSLPLHQPQNLPLLQSPPRLQSPQLHQSRLLQNRLPHRRLQAR